MLKVEKIVMTHVRVPLVEPFRISSGAVAEKDGIIVELHSDGLTGYGESSPMAGSFYSSDTPDACWKELCNVVAPAVLGSEYEGPADWNNALDHLPSGNFTKAGVETAFWDLRAKQQNQPLHELLGGQRHEVESGLAVGLYETVEDTLRTIERYLASGYRRVKLKIEPGAMSSWLKQLGRNSDRFRCSSTPMALTPLLTATSSWLWTNLDSRCSSNRFPHLL